ncbi:flagellar hook-length control protein FliK [Caproiciproducens faecalis]|uniref:Flagellar hook-length control protein FliK n=1 Tax=Caproiciproducens faecalis TaxID=2820301 RepID=A0ABS7DQ75_9FIRM|nr:flagellar hook-length control protein FliK [Caproiciproducens faecalis]MBW7573353.1 flagellar hook-length control protein FliK [Caproiciproducens faecalis]
MIQQITRSSAPQNSKTASAKNPANAFDTFLQTVTLGKSAKSLNQTGLAPLSKGKENDKQDLTESTPFFGLVDVSLLSQLLAGQSPSAAAELLQAQTAVSTANLLAGVPLVQQPAVDSAILPQIQQQAETSNPLLTANNLSQTAAASPVPGNAFLQPAADAAASSVSADGTQKVLAEQAAPITPATATAVGQPSEPVPLAANSYSSVYPPAQVPNTGEAPVTAQTSVQTKEPDIPQTAPPVLTIADTDKIPSASVLQIQPEDATLSDEKSTVNMDAAAQSQDTAQFSDLYRTGNVVIKISDTPSDTPKTTFKQVADQILVNYKAGKPEFQMDLYPKDLGKVSVKLAMQSGVLTVSIQASNPKTQSMLMENSSDIRSLLQTTVNQPIQVSEPAQEKAWYQQNQQNQQNQAQQQEEQQHNQQLHRVGLQDSDTSTDDFLTVMQQLKQHAYRM